MASEKNNGIAVVGYHTGIEGSNLHTIRLKYFWDEKEAQDFYKNVSTNYAKSISSKDSGYEHYSQEWSKYIPSEIGNIKFQDYWVSYIDSYDAGEELYICKYSYFSDLEQAKECYEKLNQENKKLVNNFEVLESEGYESAFLL